MPVLTAIIGITAISTGCRGVGASAIETPAVEAPGVMTPALETPALEARRAEALRLSFVADFNPPRPPSGPDPLAPRAQWDRSLGGLSGLYYSRRDALLYAISDDPRRSPARMYTFDVQLTETSLEVVPRSVIPLREREPSGTLIDLDSESIAGDDQGSLYVGSENHDDQATQRWPRILRVQQDGLLTGSLALPAAFLPEAGDIPTRGPRTNLGFEGLSISPSGRWLSAITEEALRQDGPLASFEQGSTVRLLRWDLTGPAAPSEFAYRTEPIPRPPSGTALDSINGVSALASLDDHRLLVLERAYVDVAQGPDLNVIRIFQIALPTTPPPSAPPVDRAGAATTLPADVVPKQLLLDLDDIVGQLEPGKQSLDNFEGMALGPDFPSGERSLLLVSDDNFRDQQRTVFLAFRLAEH